MFSSVSSNKLNWLRLKGVLLTHHHFVRKKHSDVSFITNLERLNYTYLLFIIAFTHLAHIIYANKIYIFHPNE